jgi:nucleotide-binding universal stress UspA family protein
MPYKNISVALSGKSDEIPIIDEAVRLAITLKAHLTVVHINDPHAGEISMMMDMPRKYDDAHFKKMFYDAGHEEISNRLDIRIEVDKSIPKGIAKLTNDSDLLVIGHAKMGKLKELFTDSIDEMAVNHVRCPVLIIKTK